MSKSKKSVFSDTAALYLHNFSDRNPSVYDITIPHGYGNSYKDEKNVKYSLIQKGEVIWD